jgi:hypothetical protein
MDMITNAMASAGYQYPGPPIESVSEPRDRSQAQ